LGPREKKKRFLKPGDQSKRCKGDRARKTPETQGRKKIPEAPARKRGGRPSHPNKQSKPREREVGKPNQKFGKKGKKEQ